MSRWFSQDRAELEAHFAERVQTYLDLGMSEEEANRLAQEKFGDLDSQLRALRYQRHVGTPLKVIRFAIYWSLRGTLDSCLLCLMGAPIFWLITLFLPEHNLFFVLLGVSPLLSMTDVGYRLDAQYPKHKHWGVFGTTLFWMSLYLVGGLLLSKSKPSNLHALWLLIPLLLAPPYVRFTWRRNAKPTV